MRPPRTAYSPRPRTCSTRSYPERRAAGPTAPSNESSSPGASASGRGWSSSGRKRSSRATASATTTPAGGERGERLLALADHVRRRRHVGAVEHAASRQHRHVGVEEEREVGGEPRRRLAVRRHHEAAAAGRRQGGAEHVGREEARRVHRGAAAQPRRRGFERLAVHQVLDEHGPPDTPKAPFAWRRHPVDAQLGRRGGRYRLYPNAAQPVAAARAGPRRRAARVPRGASPDVGWAT